jgi:hypothetical protein
MCHVKATLLSVNVHFVWANEVIMDAWKVGVKGWNCSLLKIIVLNEVRPKYSKKETILICLFYYNYSSNN